MPDWKNEASRKLANARFPVEEREEVSRELASYLEDLYNDALQRGLDEHAAIECAIAELHQDARLGPKLRRAREENTMNRLTKGVWLPGSMSLVASAIFLAIFETAGMRWYVLGHFGSVASYSPVTISVPWLCVLPFLAAGSAYFSRRAGSGRSLRLVAGLFPVFVFLAGMVLVVPLSFAINGVPATKAIFPSLAAGVLSMIVIPGFALLLGVLPFLRSADASRRTA